MNFYSVSDLHAVADHYFKGDALFSGNDTLEARKKALETIPLGRLATPAEIGSTVAWLGSDEATMLTGAVIDVDGGRGV
jgi:3-oxoacyl-[acyl-carrier protein] reductase